MQSYTVIYGVIYDEYIDMINMISRSLLCGNATGKPQHGLHTSVGLSIVCTEHRTEKTLYEA